MAARPPTHIRAGRRPTESPWGGRVAGVLFLLFGALGLWFTGSEPDDPAPVVATEAAWAFFDLGVGLFLLGGWRRGALVVSVAGTVLFLAMSSVFELFALRVAPLELAGIAVAQIVVYALAISLLVGRPGVLRMTLTAALPMFFLSLVPIVLMSDRVAVWRYLHSEPLGAPVTVLEGAAFPYFLTAPPNDRWYLVSPDPQRPLSKDEMSADRSLVRLGVNEAVVLVFAETIEGCEPVQTSIGTKIHRDCVAVTDLAAPIRDELTTRYPGSRVLESGVLDAPKLKGYGVLLSTGGEEPQEVLTVGFVVEDRFYRVLGLWPAATDPRVVEEVRGVVLSFEPCALCKPR